MSKKPHKVDDPSSAYAAKKPAKKDPVATTAGKKSEFETIAGKLLSERKELLRKLAQ